PDAQIATDISEVCQDDSVDAVIVVTPESAHRVVAEPALAAGKHVIVEKPLATTEEDALAMQQAAEQAGKLLMTSFLLRFDYRYAQVKQRLQEVGNVRNVFAYRLIMRDSVEEKVLELQNNKKDLADAIIKADNSLIRNLKREDLELLLN
ncbi:MAG: Gfo/Idh/MocA family oxidoreductase, partial [Verrucomicrobiota bacterium]